VSVWQKIGKAFEYNSIKDLDGLRIATSYPNTVNEYFNFALLLIFTKYLSVEIAPNIGLVDAIVDIVSSGSTLFKKQFKGKLRSFM
jgi:ATP phosphoribosyltransferase